MPGEGKRIWDFDEAQSILGSVRERTRRAVEAVAALDLTNDEEDDAGRVKAAWILAEWARDIEALGVEVKGPWLVDFDCGSGYYCWRWPEEKLEFFHGYEDGFAGRTRIQ